MKVVMGSRLMLGVVSEARPRREKGDAASTWRAGKERTASDTEAQCSNRQVLLSRVVSRSRIHLAQSMRWSVCGCRHGRYVSCRLRYIER